MTVHARHPGPTDRREFLVDGCPRCTEYVEDLGLHFDEDRFRAFWAKMVRVELDDAEGYDSGLDRTLGRRLFYVALALQRAFGLDPRTLRSGRVEKGLHVLVVEDDREIGGLVVRALREGGADPLLVATVGAAAAAFTDEAAFDVVLTDYELPDGTGVAVLYEVETLRYRPTTILWSGLDRTRELADLGAVPDHVFTKDNLPEIVRLILEVRP